MLKKPKTQVNNKREELSFSKAPTWEIQRDGITAYIEFSIQFQDKGNLQGKCTALKRGLRDLLVEQDFFPQLEKGQDKREPQNELKIHGLFA